MRKLLAENPEAVRVAGETLAELADLLRVGNVDAALALVERARRGHAEWQDLDSAVAGLEGYLDRRRRMARVERVVVDLAAQLVGFALRRVIPG